MDSIDELTNSLRNINLNHGYVTLSQKGKPQLHYNHQYYRKNGKPTKQGKINWRCIVPKCNASCMTYSDAIGDNVLIVSINDTHDTIHNTSPSKLARLERRRILGAKAAASDAKPRKILHELDDEEFALSYQAERQFINRKKKKYQPNYPPQPTRLSDIQFPDFFKINKKK